MIINSASVLLSINFESYEIMFTYTDPRQRLGDIQTPMYVSRFLHQTLKHLKPSTVLDPACGQGNLLIPWRPSAVTIGIDKNPDFIRAASEARISHLVCGIYENLDHRHITRAPDLVMMNPPWNRHWKNENYCEVFLKKTVDLFGPKIPICLLCPMGLRLNQEVGSKRKEWLKKTLEITSIISCPRNMYPDTQFHSEIILFNCKKVKPHYWMPDPSETES